MMLVGVGGGAAALLPFTADIRNLKYRIPENAEVISSIGVALAMVRDVVERVIPNASSEDIAEIKREAMDLAIKSGAVPESIEVHIEIDPQTQKVTAIALGSTEVKTTDLLKECTIDEIKTIAAESMSVKLEDVTIEAHNDSLYVISAKKKNCNEIRIVDSKGFIKIQRRDGMCLISTAGKVYEDMKKIWEQGSLYKSDLMLVPDMYVVLGARVLDLSGISYFEQIEKVLSTEIADYDDNKELIIVGGKNDM